MTFESVRSAPSHQLCFSWASTSSNITFVSHVNRGSSKQNTRKAIYELTVSCFLITSLQKSFSTKIHSATTILPHFSSFFFLQAFFHAQSFVQFNRHTSKIIFPQPLCHNHSHKNNHSFRITFPQSSRAFLSGVNTSLNWTELFSHKQPYNYAVPRLFNK